MTTNYPNFNVPMFPNAYPFSNTPNTTTPPMETRWIQGGENAAKAYNIAPGGTAMLIDTEESYFYIKSVNFNGYPNPLRKFKYEEVIDSPNSNLPDAKEVPNYVTKEDFNAAIDKLTELINSKNIYNKNTVRGDKNGKSDIQRNE